MHTQHDGVESMLWGKVQVAGEHVDNAGGVRRLILKAPVSIMRFTMF